MDNDFNKFWDAYQPDETRFPRRRAATFLEWLKRTPAARKAMLTKVLAEGAPKWKNPFFYVQEFPNPEPKDYNGTPELESVRDHSRIACYNGHWGIYTFEDIKLFNLQTKD